MCLGQEHHWWIVVVVKVIINEQNSINVKKEKLDDYDSLAGSHS